MGSDGGFGRGGQAQQRRLRVPPDDQELLVRGLLLLGGYGGQVLVGDLEGSDDAAELGHLRLQLLERDHGVAQREHPDRDVLGPLEEAVDQVGPVLGGERAGGTGRCPPASRR